MDPARVPEVSPQARPTSGPGGLLLLAGAAVLGAATWARGPAGFSVRDRTALVTGGSRGLGLAVARELLRRGARVAVCGRDRATLDRARADLEARGARVLAEPCDVTDRRGVEALVRKVRHALGPIDVLVNNAGVVQVGPVDLMTDGDFEDALGTHFWGPLYVIRAVLPDMRARGRGRIANVASIGGLLSVPHLLPYSASKFALVGLSEGLAAELAADGIRVTTVCPGLMRTGSPRHGRFKGRHRAEHAWFSLAAALPGSSMSAERAARRLVTALERGEPWLVLSLPAKAAARVHGLFPGATTRALGLVSRALPRAGPGGPGAGGAPGVPGRESGSWLSPSWLTALDERAATRLNQEAPR
jgi:NAD(P)-dependent dehydrogenase (short-subunit alcohol dehydrogenase family)